jgi:hypothetical protein
MVLERAGRLRVSRLGPYFRIVVRVCRQRDATIENRSRRGAVTKALALAHGFGAG